MRRLLLISLGTFFLSACSTTNAQKTNSSHALKSNVTAAVKESASSEKGYVDNEFNVFIIRKRANMLSAVDAKIRMEGENVVKLGDGEFTALRLPPGLYELKVSFPILTGMPSKKKKVEVLPNQKNYFEIATESGLFRTPQDRFKNGSKTPFSCCVYIQAGNFE